MVTPGKPRPFFAPLSANCEDGSGGNLAKVHAPRAGLGVYDRNPASARKAAGPAAGGPWAVAEGAGGPGGAASPSL